MNRSHIIAKRIEENHWNFGAEVGIWKGHTFFYLLDRFPKLVMAGADQWKIYDGFGDKESTGYINYSLKNEDVKDVRQKVISKANDYGDRAKIFDMPSLEAAEYIKDGSLDFVFIDADHRTSFVRADIAAWKPKIKQGGMLFGHDWNLKSVSKSLFGFNIRFMKEDHIWIMKI